MSQDKNKYRECDLSLDYIFMLNDLQKIKCILCHIEMKWEWDRSGDIFQCTVDRIHNEPMH